MVYSAINCFSKHLYVYRDVYSVVRLLDFHNRSSKIIGQEISIDDRL